MTTTPTLPLVLASSSPYRQQLLRTLGLAFSCASPDIDESSVAGESAYDLVARLAERKARALASQHPASLIIGSDQVALLEDKILGKPGNKANAEAQLKQCSGRRVTFFTGLSVHDSHTGESETLVDTFTVHFRHLSQAEVHRYIEKESPLDCAGSFKSEGLGITLFERLEGSDPNTLVGLPLVELCKLLRQRGFELP